MLHVVDPRLTTGDSYAIRAWAACLEPGFHNYTSHGQTLHPPHVCRQFPLGMRRCFHEAVHHQLLSTSLSPPKPSNVSPIFPLSQFPIPRDLDCPMTHYFAICSRWITRISTMYITMAITIGLMLASIPVTVFQCDPVRAAWDFTITNGRVSGIQFEYK